MAFPAVQARRPELAVPWKRHPRGGIGPEPVRMKGSPYYRRQLAEGNLLPAATGNFSSPHQS